MNTSIPSQLPFSLRTILNRIWQFLTGHGKLPAWAVLLLVLFGSGGIFYAVQDYINKQKPVEKPIYDGGPVLPVRIGVSFFPPVSTSLSSGVYIEVENTSISTVPNVRAAFNTENARIQSCDSVSYTHMTLPTICSV